jgi:hypothetical protein
MMKVYVNICKTIFYKCRRNTAIGEEINKRMLNVKAVCSIQKEIKYENDNSIGCGKC